ncbi:MAG: ATP-binding protein [Candidatus Aenigmarchaeota archaeon]|nr:ATP-binding protein [Candidatus Aenigmarchaeota archaeon]
MRTEQRWNEKIRAKMLPNFTPRLKRDMETIEPPKLPKLQSYFVYGEVHTGKTVWAAFMLLEAEKQAYLNATNHSIKFRKTSEILQGIKSLFNNPEKSVEDYVEALSEADFLVLDDFGSERPTDWVLGLLYLLIDRRYENMKTTIFTSNHSLDEIAEKFGDDRITSRIERMCKIIHKTKF